MGQTISVTLPVPLVEQLQRTADLRGVSRSRLAGNILMNWQETQKEGIVTKANKCKNLEYGDCRIYKNACTLTQEEAVNCDGYFSKE